MWTALQCVSLDLVGCFFIFNVMCFLYYSVSATCILLIGIYEYNGGTV
jgi:hypothetical protein